MSRSMTPSLLPQYSAPFSPEESQGSPVNTAVHQEPLIHSQSCGGALPAENVILQHPVNESYLNVLTTQFNSNIFVAAMLFGPLNSLRTNPDITHNVVLRPLSTITCIADVTALLCAIVIRARLFYVKRRGRAEQFGQDFAALQKFRYGSTILCLHSPVILIFGVMFLFAGELAGLVMTLSLPQYRDTEPKPWSPAEAGVVWAGVGACLMYLVGATFTAMCLGRNRRISCTILSQERPLEKA